MISGVELGNDRTMTYQVEILASATKGGAVEIWLDDLATGKLIATIPVRSMGGENNWRTFAKSIKNISGHYDVFVKFASGHDHDTFVKAFVL